MRFRIIHKDRPGNLNTEKFKTLAGLVRDYEYIETEGWKYNRNLEIFFDNSLAIKTYFPDEIADVEMIKLPNSQLVNYARIFEFEDEGELPDDLSPTEAVLTDLLWGKRNKDIVALLVAALENMDISDVHESMMEMGLE